MKTLTLIGSLILLGYSCHKPIDTNAVIEDVRSTELAFSAYSDSIGVEEAFLKFSANDAVIVRGDQVIKGKQEIKDYFSNQTIKNVKLLWSPDFIDVSESGDLAYTYGKYTFSATDSIGNSLNSEGIFHTVWKKQQNGDWKFVYD